MTTAAAEPRLTARQWAQVVSDPTRDRAYELTGLGTAVSDYLARRAITGLAARTLDQYERDLARLCILRPDKTAADITAHDLPDLADANLARANLARAKGLLARRVSDLHILYDQPGPVRAYKLVTSAGEGPYNGGIRYEVGGSYEVMDADADEARDCGPGINLATLPWCCREWRPGYRILLCEFEAGDIAAVPIGGGGKFRVRRCRVVGEINLAELGLGDTTDLEAE